ncbi:hypothetical protein DFH09DRAFT_1353806 [Mycena vulgaris]|nr:hypothetical protein DFH09DRAFT_1353806 [Mycena vulgaris]
MNHIERAFLYGSDAPRCIRTIFPNIAAIIHKQRYLILCYDHLLTFGSEIKFQHWDGGLAFRYHPTREVVPLYLGPVLPSSFIRCHAWNIGQIVLTILQCVLVGNVLGLRIYAMYNFSKAVLCVLFSAGVVTTSLAVWSVIGQSWILVTDMPGCDYAVSKQSALRMAVAWESLLLCDVTIFLFTIFRIFRQPFKVPGSILSHMARDGALYFGVLAIVNLGNILMFYLGDPWTASSLSWFTSTISVTMVSRLMLSLHKAADVGILATSQNATSLYFHSRHHNQSDEESTAS